MKRRRNVALAIVAIAGLLALTFVVVGRAADQPAPPQTYIRISLWGKGYMYLQFQGNEVRAATSASDLATAAPVAMRASRGLTSAATIQSATFTLPIPAEMLPEGITAVKASVQCTKASGAAAPVATVNGELALCRVDDEKTEWQCAAPFGKTTDNQPERSPVVDILGVENPTLTVTGKPSKGKLGIALDLTLSSHSGLHGMSDVRKNGKPVQAQVEVLDASGKSKVLRKGPLSTFRWARADVPVCTAALPKGSYTCSATFDVGPFGGVLKGEDKVEVP